MFLLFVKEELCEEGIHDLPSPSKSKEKKGQEKEGKKGKRK